MQKLIIVTAPSGGGKTTIVKHLLSNIDKLSFSISATTRAKRLNEVDGIDYYFFSIEAFNKAIAEEQFVEWEEVYPNQFYGTLKSEVDRIWKEGNCVVFDIDVKGAMNLKGQYGKQCLTLFIKPPSKDVLIQRLANRKTETERTLAIRERKIDFELSFANKFDRIVINDNLEIALAEAMEVVSEFLKQ